MRRATLAITLGLAFASYALPQEPGQAPETKHEVEQGDPWIWGKWANFGILAIGMGFLVRHISATFFFGFTRFLFRSERDVAPAVPAPRLPPCFFHASRF